MEAWERQCRMYNGTTTAIETKKRNRKILIPVSFSIYTKQIKKTYSIEGKYIDHSKTSLCPYLLFPSEITVPSFFIPIT